MQNYRIKAPVILQSVKITWHGVS